MERESVIGPLRASFRVRRPLAGVMMATAVLWLSACSEVEEETTTSYEPAALESVRGNDDVKRVTVTAEGARRIGLKTAKVAGSDGREVVPYAALIYDAEGDTYVYTSTGRLSYLRKEVDVRRIDGHRALLSRGPPSGTTVVTVGAAEVYGAELEIASQ
jgi:hypothetical protein